MPKLPVYENQVFPNAGPVAELAGATEKRAYYKGQAIEQGFNAIGRGVSKVQNEYEKRQEAKRALEEQEDIANLTVQYAVQNAKTAVEWKRTLAESDPSDSSTQERFMETITPQYETIHSQAKTEKGRRYSTQARAEAWASTYMSTSADQMNLSSEAAVDALDKVGNAYSSAAFYDPGNWKSHLSQMDMAIDAQIDGIGLNSKDALKLRTASRGTVARSALKGMIDTNPQAAQEAINNGEFAGYLDGEELSTLDNAAEERIRALDRDKVAKVTEEEKAKKKEANGVLLEIQSGIVVEKNGTMTVPGDYFDKLNKWKNEYKEVISDDDYSAAVSLGAAEIRRSETDDLKTSDANMYKKLTEKLVDGTLTERDANLARANGLLSTKDYTFFKGAVPNDQNGESREVKDFAKFLMGNKGYVILSAGTLKDSIGESLFTDYQSDMMDEFQKRLARGDTVEQIREYARAALPSYTLSRADLRRLSKRDKVTGNIGYAGNIDPPSIDQPTKPIGEFMGSKPVERVSPDAVTLKYSNQGAIRSLPLVPTLEHGLKEAVGNALGKGYTVEVFSGGQHSDEGPRTGSNRHDDGHAADVYIVGPDGKKVTDRKTLDKLKDYWLKNNYGSVGTYMKGMGIHLDDFTKKKLGRGQSLTWNY